MTKKTMKPKKKSPRTPCFYRFLRLLEGWRKGRFSAIINGFMPRVLAVLFGILLPALAHAQFMPPCPVGSILPCAGGGSLGLVAYLSGVIFPAIRLGFVAVAVVMFTAYAGRMLMESEEESAITDVKNAYTQAVVGAVIISISTFIVDGFGRSANFSLVNPAPVTFAALNVIGYFKLIIGVLISIVIVIQAIRLMLLQGQESEIEQARTKFFHSLLGVAVILLANALVAAVQPGSNSIIINEEIKGVINFSLELLVLLAVLSIMVAGVFLIASVDESLKERAKKIMFATVIALIVVLCAYVIVNYFLLL